MEGEFDMEINRVFRSKRAPGKITAERGKVNVQLTGVRK